MPDFNMSLRKSDIVSDKVRARILAQVYAEILSWSVLETTPALEDVSTDTESGSRLPSDSSASLKSAINVHVDTGVQNG